MSRIPHVHRRGARYHFRRRLHLRNPLSQPVEISLRTADPVEARARSAMLSARFAVVMRRLAGMFSTNRDFLTGKEIAALMRAELENELARAIAPSFDDEQHAPYIGKMSRITAEAYDLARRADRPTTVSNADEQALLARGFDAVEVDFIQQDLEGRCQEEELSDADVRLRLELIGAPVNEATIVRARGLMLKARSEAHHRATHLFDPQVQNAADPVAALLDPAFTPGGPLPLSSASADCQFLIHDRAFSSVIGAIVEQLRLEKVWKGDCKQQTRIAHTFAWIAGDKALGNYTHLDVDAFKTGLQGLPVGFYFGSRDEGTMSRPFAEVVAEIATPSDEDRRNPKTINRDLSFMSTIDKHLAKTGWRPKVPNTKVLDFSGATIAIRSDGVHPRPPWRRVHMERLFASPIYLGGGRALRRLHTTGYPEVFHDAAYYAPLFWYYHQACREEVCGLGVAEIHEDAAIPYFEIRDNAVRGKDGEKAGEKRMARKRSLPIHPELMRLGLGSYMKAIRAEGHEALFPELYVNMEKRGGAQFYNVAWRHIYDWIAAQMDVPISGKGKTADIHSIRSLGSSFYEKDGVNEIVRRTGTNAKHYSQRMETEGLEVVLGERLEFRQRYVPVITADVPPKPLNLLPFGERSRLGAGVDRKSRSDSGVVCRGASPPA